MHPQFHSAATSSRHGLFTLIAMCCLMSSCSEPRYEGVPTFPVTGMVTVNGSPVEGATVKLTPVEDLDEPDALSSRGNTNAQGEFSMSTYVKDDGVPAGRYAVSIVWLVPADPPRKRDPGPDRLHRKYADPHQTPWKVEITEGENTLEPFTIEAAGVNVEPPQ